VDRQLAEVEVGIDSEEEKELKKDDPNV